MSLSATVVKAVQAGLKSLDDLMVEAVLTTRVKHEYVPGQVVQYDEVDHDVRIAIINFEFKEIDGTVVQSTDMKGIISHDKELKINTNDTIQTSMLDVYRIMRVQKFIIGETNIVTQLHLRPT